MLARTKGKVAGQLSRSQQVSYLLQWLPSTQWLPDVDPLVQCSKGCVQTAVKAQPSPVSPARLCPPPVALPKILLHTSFIRGFTS
jgi:hypothetical protein